MERRGEPVSMWCASLTYVCPAQTIQGSPRRLSKVCSIPSDLHASHRLARRSAAERGGRGGRLEGCEAATEPSRARSQTLVAMPWTPFVGQLVLFRDKKPFKGAYFTAKVLQLSPLRIQEWDDSTDKPYLVSEKNHSFVKPRIVDLSQICPTLPDEVRCVLSPLHILTLLQTRPRTPFQFPRATSCMSST